MCRGREWFLRNHLQQLHVRLSIIWEINACELELASMSYWCKFSFVNDFLLLNERNGPMWPFLDQSNISTPTWKGTNVKIQLTIKSHDLHQSTSSWKKWIYTSILNWKQWTSLFIEVRKEEGMELTHACIPNGRTRASSTHECSWKEHASHVRV